MKKLELFQCEVCLTQFKSKEECVRCEKGHQKEFHIVKARYLPYTQDASGMPVAITFSGSDGRHYTYKR